MILWILLLQVRINAFDVTAYASDEFPVIL